MVVIEDCTCEMQGGVTCDEDGTCADSLEDCEDEELSNALPKNFSISMPYPNPFNPVVKLDFSLPTIDIVDVNIYDINGFHITNLMSGSQPAGHYALSWNATTYPTGIYFIQFISSDIKKTMKIMLIK